MTAGALTVFLSYLNKFFKPVQDLATMTNSIAQTAVGVERIQAILDADARHPRAPRRARTRKCSPAKSTSNKVAFAYDAETPVLKDVSFHIKPGQMVGVVGPDRRRQSPPSSA